MGDASSILVIHQGALGDVLLSLPALDALRVHFGETPWILAGRNPALTLLKEGWPIRHFLSLDGREWALLFQAKGPVPTALADVMASCKKGVIFSAHDPASLLKGLEWAGLRDCLVLPSFPDEVQKLPLPLLQKRVLESQGIPWPGKKDRYFCPSPSELHQARLLLKGYGLHPEKNEIWAIHPGSGSPEKNWPWERFLQAAGSLRDHFGLQPIILLGPVEEESGSVPVRPFQEAGFPVLPSPPLSVLAALLSLCRGYLGNDSGISHLAALVGLPTLALFGPTDPTLWGPQGPMVEVLSAPYPCAPCPRERRRNCSHRGCLQDLAVSQVVGAVLALRKQAMSGSPRPGPAP